MEKSFETRVVGGVKIIFFPWAGGNVAAITENGDNLGAWISIESAVKYIKDGNASPLGKVTLSYKSLIN